MELCKGSTAASVSFESTLAASLAHLSRDSDPLTSSAHLLRRDSGGQERGERQKLVGKAWREAPAAIGRGARATEADFSGWVFSLALPAAPKARPEPEPAPPAGLGPAPQQRSHR